MKSNFGLKKKMISSLSVEEQENVRGGAEAAGTTSFNRCSVGFICCGRKTKGSFTYCESTQDLCLPRPEE